MCACVCVYQFTASLHTVQENQNGSHENQHPAAVAVATQAAASGKCKVNFVEGHASSSSSSRTGASLGHQLATLYSATLPAIGTVVFVFTLLCLCVCAAILCALFGLTFHFALRLAFCGLTVAVSVYSIPRATAFQSQNRIPIASSITV